MMKLTVIAIRVTALIVLLASFSDYWAYDRWDPTAPINSCGAESVAAFGLHGPSTAGLRAVDLPDDRCVCCSPTLTPSVPAIPVPAWNAFSEVSLRAAGGGPGGFWPTVISPSPPFRDSAGFGLPLRI